MQKELEDICQKLNNRLEVLASGEMDLVKGRQAQRVAKDWAADLASAHQPLPWHFCQPLCLL